MIPLKKTLTFFAALAAGLSCTVKVKEDRVECLQIEIFADVTSDGEVEVALSVPVGDLLDEYVLKMDIDGKPVDQWYLTSSRDMPERIVIPESRVIHLTIPRASAGEHELHALLYSESFQAEARTVFDKDNIAISADVMQTSSGYQVMVRLDRGSIGLEYGMEVTLDDAPVQGLAWKKDGFVPEQFHFPESRTVGFTFPRPSNGQHALGIRVFSGYLSTSSTIIIREMNDFSFGLDARQDTVGYLLDINLIAGRTTGPYTLQVQLDGEPIPELLDGNGENLDGNALQFPEDRHLYVRLGRMANGEHTAAVTLSDNGNSATVSKTFFHDNGLSIDFSVMGRFQKNNIQDIGLELITGSTNDHYSVELTLDDRDYPVSGNDFFPGRNSREGVLVLRFTRKSNLVLYYPPYSKDNFETEEEYRQVMKSFEGQHTVTIRLTNPAGEWCEMSKKLMYNFFGGFSDTIGK